MTGSNPLVSVRKNYYAGDPDDETHGIGLLIWCPGCKCLHRPQAVDPDNGTFPKQGETWTWNGATDETFTISPSLLCHSSVHLCEGEHPPTPCTDPDCEEKSHAILNEDWRTAGITQRGHPTPHTRDPAWGDCHSFITNGQWEFLGDCAHELKGQTVPMVPLPDWAVRD